MVDRDGPTVTVTSPYPFAPTLATCGDAERLVPGSVESLHTDADGLEAQARSLAQHADDLRKLAPQTWTGRTADGWTCTRGQLADALQAVSEVHATAAAVLRAHADTISAGRRWVEAAVAVYAKGCALTRAAGMVVPIAGAAAAAADPGAAHRSLAEQALHAAQEDVAASGRAAASMLDELDDGLPDGQWHADEFFAGIGRWLVETASTQWKFSTVRLMVDGGGYVRDSQAQADAVDALWAVAAADPVEAGAQLVDLQGLRDRPAQWWGHLAPDLALTAAGGVGAGVKALGASRVVDQSAVVGTRLTAPSSAWAADVAPAERLSAAPGPSARATVPTGKLDYFFGKVAPDPHNTPRAQQLQQMLADIGVFDNDAGRALVREHLESIAVDDSNILRVVKRARGPEQVRDSLFAGPFGFVKFESSWLVEGDGIRLTTAISYRK